MARRRWSRKRKILLGVPIGFLLLALVGGGTGLYLWGRDDPAQYASRVEAIEHRFASVYPTGEVLITGSSYLERWSTSETDLAPLKTTNIGIGGTKAGDHLAYLDRMVVPPSPQPTATSPSSSRTSPLTARPHASPTADSRPATEPVTPKPSPSTPATFIPSPSGPGPPTTA